jgi:murein DD-endopeptidase MepM/ murein hydrolase activator NlpD
VSPTLRALRRLVARDPEAPIRVDLGVTRASLTASLREAVRPIGDSVGEILGDDRTAGSAGPTVATGPAGALGGPLARARRHRHLLPLGACLLLVAVAAVSAMTPVSASGAPAATPGDSSAIAGSDSGTDQSVDQTSVDQDVGSDLGDSNVYNVIQTVAIAPGSGDFQIYVVQSGDSLSKIAAKFGLSRNTIYWANTSRVPNPSSIRVGLKLLIPPVDGVTVTVKANNTVSGLASKYKVSSQKILVANSMSSAALTVGQLLVIPVAQVPAIPTPKPPSAASLAWHGGKLRWPVPGHTRLSQGYWSGHRAIDIIAPTGTPVVAAYGGTVIFAGWKYSGDPGYGGGLVVWISHGGKLWTTYNHLSAEYVHVGQVVTAGQRIGSIGMTGNATGPHLHFEVWSCYPWTGLTTACARNPLNYF